MSNTDEVRWKQRFANYDKALGQLKSACEKEEYTELERAGLVQMFEFTIELAWKTLKDLLFYEGFDAKSPRDVIRMAHQSEYLDDKDTETFLEALEQRNILSHTYEEETAAEAEKLITKKYCPVFVRIYDVISEKL